MQKYLNNFLISPAAVMVVLGISYALAFTFYSGHLTDFSKVWGIIDCSTYVCYIALFISLSFCRKDFVTKTEKNMWLIFCFFAGAAFLREAGIQHWLTFTDTTAFKLRFFTNPNNPLFEKIIAFFCLALISGLFIYTMFLYLIPAFKGFFLKMSGSWTVITLLSTGAVCKIVDRLPSNLKKSGIFLDENGTLFGVLQICEETLELMLPVLGVIALMQFHKNKKLFYPHKVEQEAEQISFRQTTL